VSAVKFDGVTMLDGGNSSGLYSSGDSTAVTLTNSRFTGTTLSAGDLSRTYMHNVSLGTQKANESSVVTLSGDGSNQTFAATHTLRFVPRTVALTPLSAAAAKEHYVSAVGTSNISIAFDAAPASASNNLVFSMALAATPHHSMQND